MLVFHPSKASFKAVLFCLSLICAALVPLEARAVCSGVKPPQSFCGDVGCAQVICLNGDNSWDCSYKVTGTSCGTGATAGHCDGSGTCVAPTAVRTPISSVFCGNCVIYNTDGTPNYSNTCVQPGPSGPVCMSGSSVSGAFNTQSIQNVEIRGFLTQPTDPVPAASGYYDDEYHMEVLLDVGWTPTPGTFPINSAALVSQYFPAQSLIRSTPGDAPIQQSLYSNSIWGGWAAVVLHVEADSWGAARGGSNWASRVPNGWFHVGQSGDSTHTNLWWPFNLQSIPVAAGGTLSLPAGPGTYVQLIGTLWRDDDHYPDLDKPDATNQALVCQHNHGGGNYWLELHGVDSMMFMTPPVTRHTLVGYSICADGGSIFMSNDQDLWSQKPNGQSYVSSVTQTSSGTGLTATPGFTVSGSSSVVTFNMQTSGSTNAKTFFDVQWATGTCTQVSRSTACHSQNCGFASDGCTGTYSCGTCVGAQTCGRCALDRALADRMHEEPRSAACAAGFSAATASRAGQAAAGGVRGGLLQIGRPGNLRG
jgi:hypothetical protein